MALKFFWRCENATLNGTHDYSAGGASMTAVGTASISGSAAKVGTNGVATVDSIDFYYLPQSGILDATCSVGAIGFWIKCPALFITSNNPIGVTFEEPTWSTTNNWISVRSTGDGFALSLRSAAVSTLELNSGATGLVAGAWYFIAAAWDFDNDRRRISVYDAGGSLISANEDTSTDLASREPTTITRFVVGNRSGNNQPVYVDNVFIGDEYADADAFYLHRDITSYTQYGISALTITDVGDGIVMHGETGVTVTGTGFGATQGASTVALATADGSPSVTQTPTSWSATEIQFTADSEDLPFGALKLNVTVGTSTASADVTHDAPAGYAWGVVDVAWPAGTYSVFEGASPAVVDGDLYQYEVLTDQDAGVVVYPDGTFVVDADADTHEFHVRVYDQSDETWSSFALITVEADTQVSITAIGDDGTVLREQTGAIITGTGFGATAGTVTIGGVAQTVTAWTATAITITVAATTPLGEQALVVNTGTAAGSATVNVQMFAGVGPIFVGPAIAIPAQQQNIALTPMAVAARFTDPTAQPLTFAPVGTWPAGVTVTAASGWIQGAPTAAGTFSGLAVRATDPDGNFVESNTFSIIVAAPVVATPVFLGPPISLVPIAAGATLTEVNIAARWQHPGGLSMAFSAVGTWPASVVVTAAGVIRGKATTAGSYPALVVRATDPLGNAADSNAFTLVVETAGTEPEKPEPTPEPAPSSPPVGGGSLSDVIIANLALTKLGATRIISFGDDTKEARAIEAVYALIRDAELRRRKWRFSLRRTQLPALAAAPEFGYGYAYQLPVDCLSILAVGDIAPGVDLSDYRTDIDTELYSVEGRTVLTDLPSPLKLRYKARVTDATQFDAAFVQAFASRLAYELAEDLTQSATKREAAAGDYQAAIREAIAANAIEVAPTPIPDDAWIISRQ